MAWRASRTHVGQSESVLRGQPSGGFVFCHDFSSGLSDHFGIKEGPGLMRLTVLNTDHAPLAAIASPFSKYLIGECMDGILPANQPLTGVFGLFGRWTA